MSERYTLSMEDIRAHWCVSHDSRSESDYVKAMRSMFDRAIAAHDIDVIERERAKVVAHVTSLASRTTGFGTTHAQEVLVKLARAIEVGDHWKDGA